MSKMTKEYMEFALAIREGDGSCILAEDEADAIAARLKALEEQNRVLESVRHVAYVHALSASVSSAPGDVAVNLRVILDATREVEK